MRRLYILTCCLGLVGIGSAQLSLYKGMTATSSGLQLQSFGSGQIEETQEVFVVGERSLKITTLDFATGGWLIFQSPPDLRAALQVPENLLKFTLRLPREGSGGGGLGGPGGIYGDRGGRLAGGGGGPASGGQTTSAMTRLRVVIETTDGKLTEFLLPLEVHRAGPTGWFTVGVPLAAIPGLKQSSGQIKQIGLFGDAPAVFYLGEISVALDQTPITGRLLVNAAGVLYDAQNVDKVIIAAGDELIFYGLGEAGSTILRYLWNFGSGKPDEVDAEGAAIRRRFPKSGEYTVTLTIADQYGIKKPYTLSVKIQVN